MKKIIFLFLLIYSINGYSDEIKTYTNKQDIENILNIIPVKIKDMNYKNLNDRLPMLGLKVKSVMAAKLTDDEIKDSNKIYKNNDILYTFFTNEPNEAVEAICPIFSSFAFIKRNNKWIAYDRTSNFLITGYKCEVP